MLAEEQGDGWNVGMRWKRCQEYCSLNKKNLKTKRWAHKVDSTSTIPVDSFLSAIMQTYGNNVIYESAAKFRYHFLMKGPSTPTFIASFCVALTLSSSTQRLENEILRFYLEVVHYLLQIHMTDKGFARFLPP